MDLSTRAFNLGNSLVHLIKFPFPKIDWFDNRVSFRVYRFELLAQNRLKSLARYGRFHHQAKVDYNRNIKQNKKRKKKKAKIEKNVLNSVRRGKNNLHLLRHMRDEANSGKDKMKNLPKQWALLMLSSPWRYRLNKLRGWYLA